MVPHGLNIHGDISIALIKMKFKQILLVFKLILVRNNLTLSHLKNREIRTNRLYGQTLFIGFWQWVIGIYLEFVIG